MIQAFSLLLNQFQYIFLGVGPFHLHLQNFGKNDSEDTLYVCYNYFVLITNLSSMISISYLPYLLNFWYQCLYFFIFRKRVWFFFKSACKFWKSHLGILLILYFYFFKHIYIFLHNWTTYSFTGWFYKLFLITSYIRLFCDGELMLVLFCGNSLRPRLKVCFYRDDRL